MDLTGKPFKASDRENNRKKNPDLAEKQVNARSLKATKSKPHDYNQIYKKSKNYRKHAF